MYLHDALHDGAPWFMLVVFTQLVALILSQTVRGSGIAQHPYSNPHDGGALASDLPPESIGRPDVEPLLVPHTSARARRARRGRVPSATAAPHQPAQAV